MRTVIAAALLLVASVASASAATVSISLGLGSRVLCDLVGDLEDGFLPEVVGVTIPAAPGWDYFVDVSNPTGRSFGYILTSSCFYSEMDCYRETSPPVDISFHVGDVIRFAYFGFGPVVTVDLRFPGNVDMLVRPPSPVPLPSAWLLMGSMIGLWELNKRRKS